MKIKHLLIGLFAVAATVACKQDEPVETPSLEVSQESLELAAKAGEASFDVTANLAWTATADQDWVNLEPASGDASKNAVTVTVTAENNTANEARTATVTVTAGELTKTVALTQAAAEAAEPEPVLTLAVNEASVAADATSYEVALTANCAWEAEATDGVTVNPATGEGDATVTLRFAANEVTSPVTHSVTFSAGEGLTAVLTLTQAAAEAAEPEPVLTLAANEASVAADATSYEVALTANCAWTAIASEGVTVDPANGEGDAAVTLAFAANEVTSPVTHTVTFSAGEDVTAVLTLTQAAAEPVLTLAANEASVAADATSYEVALTANCAWEAVATDGVTVTPATGEGDATVTLAFAANEVTSPVTHRVTFSAGEGLTAVLTLTQAAAEPKALTVAEFKALADGEKAQLTGTITRIETAYNSTYKNVSLYISDETGEVLLYRLSCDANVGEALTVGDLLTVQGNKSTHNGAAQMAQGGKYITHEDKEAPVVEIPKLTIAEFVNLDDNKQAEITGTITSISTPYDSGYKNISMTITDATESVYLYRLSCDATVGPLLTVGDEVTVQGYKTTYNGAVQMAQGGVYVSHVDKEAPVEPEAEAPYTSNVSWKADSNNKSYAEKATVNGNAETPVLKLGTSSVVGTATLTIPAGTKRVGFYGVAWNGKTGTVTMSVGGEKIYEQALRTNAGANNNSPYTMTVTSADYYEVVLESALEADTAVTVATVSGKTRVILFGVNAYAE